MQDEVSTPLEGICGRVSADRTSAVVEAIPYLMEAFEGSSCLFNVLLLHPRGFHSGLLCFVFLDLRAMYQKGVALSTTPSTFIQLSSLLGFLLHFLLLPFLVVHYDKAIYDVQLEWIHFIYVGESESSILLQKEAGPVQRDQQRLSVASYSLGAVDEVKKSITLTAWNDLLFPQDGQMTS